MLSSARAALAELGLLAPGAPLPPFRARMSGNLVLMVHADDGTVHSVKVGVRTRLDREHRGLAQGHAAMPRLVPRPLGLVTCGGFQVLVAAGIPHERLVPGDVDSPCFVRGMQAYLDASASMKAGSEDRGFDPCNAVQAAGEAIGWSARHSYCDALRPRLASLPRIPQHGDLAINNIGVAGDHIVVFDWEDFGLVDLPGFDLAILLLSLHDFDLAALRGQLHRPSVEAGLAQRFGERLQSPAAAFEQLMPAYLALFVELKRAGGYDEASIARALAALRQWAGAT